VLALSISIWKYIDSREKIVEWLKLSVYISTVFVILCFIFWNWRYDPYFVFRLKGVYFNPNMLGITMVLHIPASFFLFWYERNRNNRGLSLFYLAALAAGFVALFLSGSRASIGGLVVAGLLAVAAHYRSRLIVIMAVLALFLGATYTVVEKMFQSDFFRGVVLRQKTLDTIGGREYIWELAVDLFKEKPMLGYGFGVSDYVLSSEGDPDKLDPTARFGKQAHSSFLRSILEVGIVGTIMLVLYLIYFPMKFLAFIRKIRSAELHMLTLFIMTIIVAGLLNSMFEAWLYSAGSMITFVFWWCNFLVYKIDANMDDFVETGDTPRVTGLLG